jgi:hypothetical protein
MEHNNRAGEVILVAGAEGELSSALKARATVAVQLNFVAPFRSFRLEVPARRGLWLRNECFHSRVIPKGSPCITLPTRSPIDESLFAR